MNDNIPTGAHWELDQQYGEELEHCEAHDIDHEGGCPECYLENEL